MTAPSRRGLYQCVCGKVKADIRIPTGLGRVEPVSLLCSCRDCVGFTNAVVVASKKHFEGKEDAPDVEAKQLVTEGPGATHYIIIHDGEITLMEGKEHLRVLKLTEKTEVRRLYAACCGTPLGSAQPMTGLHPQLIQPHPNKTDDQVTFQSCHRHCAPFEVRLRKDQLHFQRVARQSKVTSLGILCTFLPKLAVSPFRKKPSNMLRNEQADIVATVGIDSIALEA